MKKYCVYVLFGFVVISNVVFVKEVLLVLIFIYDVFFNVIKVYCGKVFQGKVSKDNVGNMFGNVKFVMYV